MALDFSAAADEYLGWLQVEANRSPNTIRAYSHDLRRLGGFLAASGHSLQMDDLRREDLRAYQRHLAERQKSPASRARGVSRKSALSIRSSSLRISRILRT